MKIKIATLSISLLLSPAFVLAQDSAHALIMTIGDYPAPVPKLPGVGHDAATAAQIAQRMGIPAQNIRSLSNGQLSLNGMQRAFDELEAKLGGNDKVFIYYSGHGSRQLIKEDNGNERCAESLLTHDAQGMADQELEARLKRIAAKSQKAIVLIDACHSGGVTTRSAAGVTPAFVTKAYTAPGQKNCSKPINVLTRSLAEPKAAGSGAKNFVHIAAARDNEISLDQPGKGGVASQAWLACLSGTARDADGSGGLSAEEIRSCAQEKINQQLGNTQGYLPHHVTLTGNPGMVLGFAAKEAVSSSIAVPPTPTLVPVIVASSLAAMKDIFSSRDDRRIVEVTAPRPQLRIGKDLLDFSIRSREGGHVYVLMAGSDGKSFDLLFPNQIDRDNQLGAGASLELPRSSWQITAGGPPGRNHLLVMVSDAPRNFANAGLKPAGPFSSADALVAPDVQRVTSGSPYGAAMLTIDEIN